MGIIIHDGIYAGPYCAQINATWQRQSAIDDSPTNLLPCGYIHGYKTAADMLLDPLYPFDPRLDMLIFPVFFLYRQYVELILKKVYMNSHSPSEQEFMIRQCGHDIRKLFLFNKDRIFDIVLEHVKCECDKQGGVSEDKIEVSARQYLKLWEDVFEELAAYDQGSFAFRYNYNRNLTDSIPNPITIDVQTLRNMIEQLDTLLFAEYALEV